MARTPMAFCKATGLHLRQENWDDWIAQIQHLLASNAEVAIAEDQAMTAWNVMTTQSRFNKRLTMNWSTRSYKTMKIQLRRRRRTKVWISKPGLVHPYHLMMIIDFWSLTRKKKISAGPSRALYNKIQALLWLRTIALPNLPLELPNELINKYVQLNLPYPYK